MSTILLQLEAALADARAALEIAAEKLHDAGVQHARAKAEHDAAADSVRRVEGALNSMHGVSSVAASTPTPTGASEPVAAPQPKKRREPSGPVCNGCGEAGKIERISAQLAACSACGAQYPQ